MIENYITTEKEKMQFRSGVTTTNCFWLLKLLELGVDTDTVLAINDEAQGIEFGKGYDQKRVA